MPTLIHQRVNLARRGEHPALVGRLRGGWLVMGDQQITRGYCLLLPDPVVAHLNDFSGAAREQFLRDMAGAGDVLLALTGAARINYEMLGNLEPALHAHLVPRYDDELADLRTRPIWFHDWAAAPRFDAERDAAFVESFRAALDRAGLLA